MTNFADHIEGEIAKAGLQALTAKLRRLVAFIDPMKLWPVGYARRNFMTPLPCFASWDAFNTYLEMQCRKRQGEALRGHAKTIGERLGQDLDALTALPPTPFDACDKVAAQANSLSLARYRSNDYSVPVAYGFYTSSEGSCNPQRMAGRLDRDSEDQGYCAP